MTKDEIRKLAEEDLWFFANLVNPTYMYGTLHEKVFRRMQWDGDFSHQLFLLPRGHLKSHCIATFCAWAITVCPWITIVYLSAGIDLAKSQLYAIQNILVGDVYKRYWPEMINTDEGAREHWSAEGFNVDHPERKKRGIRDKTLIVKTVRSNFIGLHADLIIFDDVVVPMYSYTEVGRNEVRRALSQCSSVLNQPNGKIKAVGTRYHPSDAYSEFISAKYRIWDASNKEFIPEESLLWDVMEEAVEDSGDGTGNFLWPSILSTKDNRWYGFDVQTLENIRADYASKGEISQFYSQYYNSPNDSSTNLVDRTLFQYYEPKFITVVNGIVRYKTSILNVYAAMDVAWTEVKGSGSKSPDYTAIAVIGVDSEGYFYVLDLCRFRTSSFKTYYDNVISLSSKWGFRKIVVEVNSGGRLVAQEIERLARENGGVLSVIYKTNSGSTSASKRARQLAIINPKYELKSVFHTKGGLCSVLEEEIVLERPPHDDLVDALGMAMEIAKPPMKSRFYLDEDKKVVTDMRFGGRGVR